MEVVHDPRYGWLIVNYPRRTSASRRGTTSSQGSARPEHAVLVVDDQPGRNPQPRATLQTTDDNNSVHIQRQDKSIAGLTLHIDGGNPLQFGAPNINVDLVLSLDSATDQYRLAGAHDGFPAYELYVNGNQIYGTNPLFTGDDPFSLFPPEDKSVDTGWKAIPAAGSQPLMSDPVAQAPAAAGPRQRRPDGRRAATGSSTPRRRAGSSSWAGASCATASPGPSSSCSDLSSTYLGLTSRQPDGSWLVTIDRTAAATAGSSTRPPRADEEFAGAPLRADPASPAADHVDLLTVVFHETGPRPRPARPLRVGLPERA